MTPTEAQTVQDDVVRRGHWIRWFVSLENGRAVATDRSADVSGGKTVGQLVAETLDELRAESPGRPDAARAYGSDVCRRGRDLGLTKFSLA